ncbi:MAG TPA: VapC toxin family PIN domain ribonuclease [Devosia sp.]
MILPDTSIWIDHFRVANPMLVERMLVEDVLIHPFVVVELALGDLKKRGLTLHQLGQLPVATVARTEEVLHFIGTHDLMATGIGFVDAHLLVSTRVVPETRLWTKDKRLAKQAERLSLPMFHG